MHVQFEGTPAQVRADMREFLGLDTGASDAEEPAAAKPAGRGRGKAASAEGNAGASGEDATSSGGQSSAAGNGTASRDDVAKLCTTYGQPSKGGPAALQELFREFGAPNGKWSEITDDKLPALKVRLDELLA